MGAGLWVDTDCGFDDLWALAVLARAGLKVDAVSLVFGCATLKAVRANACSAWSAFGWEWPIHVGRDRAILGGLETAERILGPTGLRTAGLGLPARNADEPPRRDGPSAGPRRSDRMAGRRLAGAARASAWSPVQPRGPS